VDVPGYIKERRGGVYTRPEMDDSLVRSLVNPEIMLHPVEGNVLFNAIRVSKYWRRGFLRELGLRGVVVHMMNLLITLDDGWVRVVRFVDKHGHIKPVMLAKILKETLQLTRQAPDAAHAGLKAFAETANGIPVLLSKITRHMADSPFIVNEVCLILQMFDQWCDQKCGESDPDESNGESNTAVFIDAYTMASVAHVLVQAHAHNAQAPGRTLADAQRIVRHIVATVKKLSFHDEMEGHAGAQALVAQRGVASTTV